MGRRAKPAIDQSNLRFNNGTWQIRIKLPESLGGKRMTFNTGTADLAIAATIRDQTLAPLRMQAFSSEISRAILAQAHRSDEASRMLLDRAKETLKVTVATGPTVKEVARRFIDNRRTFKLRSGHTIYDYTRTLEAFEAVVGNLPINQVTKQHVRDFRDKLRTLGRFWNRGEKIRLTPAAEADRLSPKTIHKMVKNLSTCLGWCLREDLIDKNPAFGIDLPTVPRNPTPPPPPELADALCTLKPLRRAHAVGVMEWEMLPWFYRYTGARCGEIAQLRLRDIVTEDGILCMMVMIEKAQLRTEKNRGDDRRLVPVHPNLKHRLNDVLALRKGEPPDAKLFPNCGDYICKTTGVMRYGCGWASHYNDHAKKIWAPMHVHCWRSYVITETGRRGIPEEVRRKLVGHVPRDVHAAYNHVDLKRLVEAVNAIP